MERANSGNSSEGNFKNSGLGDNQLDNTSSGSADSEINDALFADSMGFFDGASNNASDDLAMAANALDMNSTDFQLDKASDDLGVGEQFSYESLSVENQESPTTSGDSQVQLANSSDNSSLGLPSLQFEVNSPADNDSESVENLKVAESSESTDGEDVNYMGLVENHSKVAYEHLLTIEDKFSSETA